MEMKVVPVITFLGKLDLHAHSTTHFKQKLLLLIQTVCKLLRSFVVPNYYYKSMTNKLYF